MGRPRKAWIREGYNVFYGTIDGRKVPLGVPGPKTPESQARADAEYERLRRLFLAKGGVEIGGGVEAASTQPPLLRGFSGGPVEAASTPAPMPIDVKTAVADYLEHCELRRQAARLSAGCLANYRFALAPFASAFGSRLVHALAAENGRLEVEAWAGGLHPGRDGKPAPWSATYQSVVLGVIASVFKRAGCPVRFDRPATESRGPDVALTDEQFARVLAAVHPGRRLRSDLAELLTVLRESGHRPAEVTRLTAEAFDWASCSVVVRQHKTKRKTGRNRLLVFNSAAMAVLHRQRERYGTGLLFRTSKGTAFTRATIGKQLAEVSKRVGFRVIAYGQRHSFATNAIAAGVTHEMVAAVFGHCSTQMVNKHYSHVGSRADAMRAAAERVVRK